ncbi:ABC transporter permease [Actinospica durhamensis]|uniref:ABC transporter permease n=1 Tax=Actinospica durhamensis TaxID=1508375 RepID=A0A941ENH2_9ACTN|nr:ABC transporter permease [Actinospica durhamensis]MBR7834932.1 ABC transporter permease [Actinospica durhamensis]
MIAFTVRRLLASIPVLFVSTLLVFLIVASSVDPLAPLRARNPPIPQTTIRAEAVRLGLNHSLPQRYWDWLTGLVLHGNWGTSVSSGYDIGQRLISSFFVTFRLVILAILLSLILAIAVGVLTAVRQYSRLDYAATAIGFLFLSLPTFVFAILLKSWAIEFNQTVRPNGPPIIATLFEASPNPPTSFLGKIGDSAGHLLLPTIVLALVSYASWSRFQRASMLEVLNSDYIRLARAKGLSRSRVLLRHALRNALIPLSTQVALDTAGLLGGAVITETIFEWHGMGYMFIQAIDNYDLYPLLAWLVLASTLVIVFNLIADLLYAVLDPRIRLA